MRRQRLVSLGTVFAMAICGLPALGQDSGGEPSTLDLSKEGIKYTLAGEELPMYTVVSFFFRRVDGALNKHGALRRYRPILLRELGIDPESPAEEYLAEMAAKAVEVLSVSDTDPALSGEEYREYQYRAMARKASNLGVIFQNLLEGLSEAGVSIEKVIIYCDTRVRPGTTTKSTRDDKERYLSTVAEFDKQLSRIKQD